MKVTFIHHSSFMVELEKYVLLFDYFEGGQLKGFQFQGKVEELPRDKKIYIFASHSHKDHFDLSVLKWKQTFPNITYILSKDIRLGDNYLKKNGIDPGIKESICFVSPGHTYHLEEDMAVMTLRSTDAGVAFVVTAEGKNIYHAGDLNLWKWEGAGELVNGKEEREYKREINRIRDIRFELAFVPLDGRLEKNAQLGLDYFMKNVSASHIFPMHMWQDYFLIAKYKEKNSNKNYNDRIMDITNENQAFEF